MATKLNYHMHADLQQTKINQMLLYQQPYIKMSQLFNYNFFK